MHIKADRGGLVLNTTDNNARRSAIIFIPLPLDDGVHVTSKPDHECNENGPQQVCALIVAGGRGSRARQYPGDPPKQYALVAGWPVLAHTIRALGDHPRITAVQVVIHRHDCDAYAHAISQLPRTVQNKLQAPVTGGSSRQVSVRNGLIALTEKSPDLVLVHDAARPFVSARTVDNIISALAHHEGVIAALPLSDTLKRADDDQIIVDTVPRENLWRAQTPQGFHFKALLRAHNDAENFGRIDFTDDAAVAEWAGMSVALAEGNAQNIKITTAEDLRMAEYFAIKKAGTGDSPADLRIGNGFDVHRLVEGDHIWLCGIKLAHDKTLSGHSDADVALHALTDALLGTIGEGDIGAHFPPADDKWKNAASAQFLQHAADLVRQRNGQINNVDVTIMCESPKIGPHREEMRQKIAQILQLTVERVSVKATTTERLGFTGRGEGIAAMANALVMICPRP